MLRVFGALLKGGASKAANKLSDFRLFEFSRTPIMARDS
jgi:hypothetical protein